MPGIDFYRKNPNLFIYFYWTKPKFLAMKQFILSCIAVACMVTACNNNKKTVEATSEDGKTTVSADVAKMQQVSEEMQKQAAELQKLPPLSMAELKALLPEEMMSARRSKFETVSMSGTSVATAEYNLNDSTGIELSIWDCGGPGGAGYYSTQYATMLNFQSENDKEYTKTIEFRGQKAIEHCDNAQNHCTLTYFTGKRFMVILEGRNFHPDGLKQAANELKL